MLSGWGHTQKVDHDAMLKNSVTNQSEGTVAHIKVAATLIATCNIIPNYVQVIMYLTMQPGVCVTDWNDYHSGHC